MSKLKNKIPGILKNDDGYGSLTFGLGVLIVALMLLLVAVLYIQIISTYTYVKNTASLCLNNYTIEQVRKEMQSIKSGHEFTMGLDEYRYMQSLMNTLKITDGQTSYYEDGKIRFVVKDIIVDYEYYTNVLDTVVTFTLDIPVYWEDTKIYTISQPVEVKAYFELKE